MVGFLLVTVFTAFVQYAIFERRLETMTTVRAAVSITVMFIIAALVGSYYHVNYSLEVTQWLFSLSPHY